MDEKDKSKIGQLRMHPDLFRTVLREAAQGSEMRRKMLLTMFVGNLLSPTATEVVAGITPWDSLDPELQKRIEAEIEKVKISGPAVTEDD
ncbi:MAG TPA: hypothetical protein VHS78_09410 [Candidatus Elarobacter sp.]|nr:hypothetical protein [Candidatus Elarobacter sp.]